MVLTTHSSHSIYTNDLSNWQPRAGLAYRLTDKTALRMGYGRFYDNWNSIIQLAQNYGGTWPDIGQLLAQNLIIRVALRRPWATLSIKARAT